MSLRYVKPHLFWKHVDKTEDHWLWLGTTARNGYGRYDKNQAHRVSWFLTNGQIPDGMVVDHICRERRCVNPQHLRIVTIRINSLENSESPAAKNSRKTHCRRGHEFTKENTYISVRKNGKRSRGCRTCILSKEALRKRQHIASMPEANEQVRFGRFARFSGMTWPIHIENDDDSVQWRLRYSSPSKEDLLFAASVMSAYAALVESTRRKRDSVCNILRRCIL